MRSAPGGLLSGAAAVWVVGGPCRGVGDAGIHHAGGRRRAVDGRATPCRDCWVACDRRPGLRCPAGPVLGAVIAELVRRPTKRRAQPDGWRCGWVLNIGAAITGGVGGVVAGWLDSPVALINGIGCADLRGCGRCIPVTMCAVGPSPPSSLHRHVEKLHRHRAPSDKRLVLLMSRLTSRRWIAFRGGTDAMSVDWGVGAYGCAVGSINALAVVAVTAVDAGRLSKQLASWSTARAILAGAE